MSRRSQRARSPVVAWWCGSAKSGDPLIAVLERAQAEGFLGPGPVTDHITHAQALARLLPRPTRFLDLGTGAGVPGLILATEWPDASGVLLDRRERSGTFLGDAVEELGLAHRLEIRVEAAEDAARSDELRGTLDLVVARGFGPPAVTAECARGFLKPDATLAVTEPPEDESNRWPTDHLAELGFSSAGIVSEGATTAAILKAVGEPDDRWPRRQGIPAKRPLW